MVVEADFFFLRIVSIFGIFGIFGVAGKRTEYSANGGA